MLRYRKLVLLLLNVSVAAAAETIDVPNPSFEFPVVTDQAPAIPWIDAWDERAVGLADEEDQNTGVFPNLDALSFGHLVNVDGNQLAYLSTLIGNDLRQELTANFIPGRHYRLTVAVTGSSYFPVGADEKLEIALFYFDGGVEHVIASSFVTGSQISLTSLIDVSVVTPLVAANDPWANRPIGILIRPAVDDPDDTAAEGFWDVDRVRLTAFEPLVGDLDLDGDVDVDDLNTFKACTTGPALGPPGPGCAKADLDGDGDVDQSDFGLLQVNLTGPG